MYLVGTFNRSELQDGKLPLVGIVESLTKDRLIQCKQDEDYQVINLETMQYYNADKNTWEKIEHWD